MTNPQSMMDAAKLRLRLQMNARLRLEVIAALSRVFREYHDPVSDELLAALILAVPEELVGEAQIDQGAHATDPNVVLAQHPHPVPVFNPTPGPTHKPAPSFNPTPGPTFKPPPIFVPVPGPRRPVPGTPVPVPPAPKKPSRTKPRSHRP